MKIYLHYGVGHKPVLKNSDQTKSNPKQTVKYNPSKSPKKKKKKKTLKATYYPCLLLSFKNIYIYIYMRKGRKNKRKGKGKS
jgi:hypothetical protein